MPNHRDVPSFGEILDDDEVPSLEPLEFNLLGYSREVDDSGEEVVKPHKFTFRARPTMATGTLYRVLATVTYVGDGGPGDAVATMKVMPKLVIDEDRERFLNTMDREDIWFPAEGLAGAFEWLQEQYTGVPTTPRSGSASGRGSIGSGSAAALPSGAGRNAGSRAQRRAKG